MNWEQEKEATAPGEVLEELRARLEQAEEQAREYKDLLQRATADHANYKRRIQEESAERVRMAGARIIKKLLPVVDDLELALGAPPQDQQSAEWREGLTLILNKLIAVMEREGLARVEADGRRFDPREHEAVAADATTDAEEGTITTVHQQGYKLHGNLLRPARVSVARGPRAGN